jgi:competence protein ComEC
MIRWLPYTFVRTVFFFIAGILLGIYAPDVLNKTYTIILLGVFCLIYILTFLLRGYLKFGVSVFGFIAFPIVFLAGYVHVLTQTESKESSHFMHEPQAISQYRVVVTAYAEQKEKSWKVSGEITDIKTDQWKKINGQVLLYFPRKDFSKPFNYGDVLLVHASPQSIPPPSNPGEFDYRRFLTFRNIYHQNFVRRGDVIFVEHNAPNILKDYAIQARLWADSVLHQYVSGEQEQAIASALVLGVTDGLDNELLNAYAATGAMHVLAVSGLHISIIYLIILWIFKPVSKTKSGKVIVAIVSLFILWAYAFITGLSPSVLRAVTMFTFIAVARATGRNTNIYNTLAASCFCLLLFDPYLIMSVGFQLSYLAVIGIVYLQPMMYELVEARTWLVDQIWTITCVSIAAQIATFALGLLYFHQFPNYFLLSNLLVIPISFGVLVIGLALLAASFIPVAAISLGFLLTWCIKLMNLSVIMVEWFPYSLIEGIYISTFQCWMLMIAITGIILMIQYKKFSYLVVAAFSTFVFVCAQWIHFNESRYVDKLTVYKVPGHSAIDLMSRGQSYFIADSALRNMEDKIRFHIRPNRLQSGVNRISDSINFSCTRIIPGAKLISWCGKTIIHITGNNFTLQHPIGVDIVIISNDAVQNADLLKLMKGSGSIIFDSSNSFRYSRTMFKKASAMNLKAYAVLEQGAFEFVINRT